MPSDFRAQDLWRLGNRIEPPGPAGACHRAGQGPDPVGRPDDKLSEIQVRPSGMSLRSTLELLRLLPLLPCFGAAGAKRDLATAASAWPTQLGTRLHLHAARATLSQSQTQRGNQAR
jgi:hypothetical protein